MPGLHQGVVVGNGIYLWKLSVGWSRMIFKFILTFYCTARMCNGIIEVGWWTMTLSGLFAVCFACNWQWCMRMNGIENKICHIFTKTLSNEIEDTAWNFCVLAPHKIVSCPILCWHTCLRSGSKCDMKWYKIFIYYGFKLWTMSYC